MINKIKSVFGLTDEMFNKIHNIENYNNDTRIFKLYEAALNWERESYPDPSPNLYKHIIPNKSLVDLLSEDDIDVQCILFVGQRLKLDEL